MLVFFVPMGMLAAVIVFVNVCTHGARNRERERDLAERKRELAVLESRGVVVPKTLAEAARLAAAVRHRKTLLSKIEALSVDKWWIPFC